MREKSGERDTDVLFKQVMGRGMPCKTLSDYS